MTQISHGPARLDRARVVAGTALREAGASARPR
jgi:hypothetical protein